MSVVTITTIRDRNDNQPTSEELDEVFAELAGRAPYDDAAARALRQLLLPACRRIAGTRGDSFLAAVVDAAYAEVVDWGQGR